MAPEKDTAPGAGVLAYESHGSGPRVVLVHGSITGRRTWLHQQPLAEHWTLCVPDRPGFGASAPLARGDYEAEAPLFAALLAGGAHLVGHSYGAVIALHAAALAPEQVHSLTISEPGCLAVAAHDPLVAQQLANGRILFERARELTPMEFLLAFRGGAGSTHATPERLDGELLQGSSWRCASGPPGSPNRRWQRLADLPFPKMVISGGHSPVFEAVCDTVAERLGARRELIAGRGHSIPATGAPYNERLHAFMIEAERRLQREVAAPSA